MTRPATVPHLRIARPSRDLAVAEHFWRHGVGMDVLWRTTHSDEPRPPHEHDLVMLGLPGASWHLELVADADAAASSRPSAEDLLVLYLGDGLDERTTQRVTDAGGKRVTARNPYWEQWGATFEDPDGYLLVLSHRQWTT
ncbi:VOC family protein [Phytoactinopolyspora limicola]|uniref:VOC family protein n=1 Tax=Phytoactinopolyspora limicola TaxID=2715536 RepID=UPI001408FD6B|nr:VOC family protein [Phytoactinopolyspora limicola]